MTQHLTGTDPADPTDPVATARAVVGWYGDPTISWSVLLQARLDAPVAAVAVAERLHALVERYPHLGAAPRVPVHATVDWPRVRAAFADAPYADGASLVRVAVAGDSGLLLVAAHHGATDGLGLLAILGAALDVDVVSRARGIADRRSSSAFLTSAARRLAEALLTPPARITPAPAGEPAASLTTAVAPPATQTTPAPTTPAQAATTPASNAHQLAEAGDVLTAAELPAASAGSAALTAAVTRAAQEWNERHGAPYLRAVAGLGVSRRDGHQATPVADSAFLRLRLPRDATADVVRRLIAAQPPEPDFPRSRSAVPAALTRVLASRLGSTFLASNLGIVDARGVRALAFYPTASGRSGIAVGAATTGDTTTITLRARRTDFTPAAADTFLAGIVAHLI